jgi:hypothetical protein
MESERILYFLNSSLHDTSLLAPAIILTHFLRYKTVELSKKIIPHDITQGK